MRDRAYFLKILENAEKAREYDQNGQSVFETMRLLFKDNDRTPQEVFDSLGDEDKKNS